MDKEYLKNKIKGYLEIAREISIEKYGYDLPELVIEITKMVQIEQLKAKLTLDDGTEYSVVVE